jgi:hypothetical protein
MLCRRQIGGLSRGFDGGVLTPEVPFGSARASAASAAGGSGAKEEALPSAEKPMPSREEPWPVEASCTDICKRGAHTDTQRRLE